MNLRLTSVLLAGASLLLPGCVAALVPLAAAGAVGGRQVPKPEGAPEAQAATAEAPPPAPAPAVAPVATAPSSDDQAKLDRQRVKDEQKRLKAEEKARARAEKQARDAAPAMMQPVATPPAPPAAQAVPGGMQYLYASGEAAAASLQSYLGLMNYLLAVSSDRAIGHPVQSVVLAPGSTLAAPKFVPCGKKPLALVLDIDETALLNLGFEADQVAQGGRYDQQRWEAWEQSGTPAQVEAVPGAIDAVEVARTGNIAVVFNSNRMAAYADQTAALLAGAGLGTAVHGDTLWLQGDAGTTGSAKDARRAAIAAKYCVVAMAGDQLGDFSDLFNAPGLPLAERRRLIASREVQSLWGHGWFIMPNPVYGSAIKGGMDEVFPAAGRWTPPAGVVPAVAPPR